MKLIFCECTLKDKRKIASAFLINLYKNKEKFSLSNLGKAWFVSENYNGDYNATDFIEVANYDDPILEQYRTRFYIGKDNECKERKADKDGWKFTLRTCAFNKCLKEFEQQSSFQKNDFNH